MPILHALRKHCLLASAGREKTMRIRTVVFLILVLACVSPPAARAQDYRREEIRIPMAEAGPQGLEALFIRPSAPGTYPLAVLNHGSPRDAAARAKMAPQNMNRHAMEFVRRGWAVAVLMRRGYGKSGGGWVEGIGDCGNPNYMRSGAVSAVDLRAAFAHLAKRPDIDSTKMISIGESAGGFASIALTADPPRGLVAAINFAGGRGSQRPDEVCNANGLVAAFAAFGKKSRIPMLWVYAENDRFFNAALSRRFSEVFTAGGGTIEFIMHPPFGEDGHNLFNNGLSLWTPYVDAFLKKQNLVLHDDLLPLPPGKLPPPPNLSVGGRNNFNAYLDASPNKAFAVNPKGAFAWRSARRSAAEASQEALAGCAKSGPDCKLYAVDDKLVQ